MHLLPAATYSCLLQDGHACCWNQLPAVCTACLTSPGLLFALSMQREGLALPATPPELASLGHSPQTGQHPHICRGQVHTVAVMACTGR